MKDVCVFDNNKTTSNKSLAFSHIPSKKIAFITLSHFSNSWTLGIFIGVKCLLVYYSTCTSVRHLKWYCITSNRSVWTSLQCSSHLRNVWQHCHHIWTELLFKITWPNQHTLALTTIPSWTVGSALNETNNPSWAWELAGP